MLGLFEVVPIIRTCAVWHRLEYQIACSLGVLVPCRRDCLCGKAWRWLRTFVFLVIPTCTNRFAITSDPDPGFHGCCVASNTSAISYVDRVGYWYYYALCAQLSMTHTSHVVWVSALTEYLRSPYLPSHLVKNANTSCKALDCYPSRRLAYFVRVDMSLLLIFCHDIIGVVYHVFLLSAFPFLLFSRYFNETLFPGISILSALLLLGFSGPPNLTMS
jgi:hypothetical protein